jgi:hypothetical protein
MKKVVEREQNKAYYRVLHVPIWVWVFFILPGHLTHDLYLRGPDVRHAAWLAVVAAVCIWRGWAGRLPGVETRPYITHLGVDEPNLPYRVVCYTAAWIAMLVPFALNLLGLVIASLRGVWLMDVLYAWLYYPLALAVVVATLLDGTPRARRSTRAEGAERAWFYVSLWTVIPAQLAGWAAWRLGGRLGLEGLTLARARLSVFLAVAATFFLLGLRGRLLRTARYHAPVGAAAAPGPPLDPLRSSE